MKGSIHCNLPSSVNPSKDKQFNRSVAQLYKILNLTNLTVFPFLKLIDNLKKITHTVWNGTLSLPIN